MQRPADVHDVHHEISGLSGARHSVQSRMMRAYELAKVALNLDRVSRVAYAWHIN
jgi:hypothetical protein